MAAVVETKGLTKVYRSPFAARGVRALHNLDLSIRDGSTFGLVGPNGSGKTTCLKLLLGLLYPTEGTMTVFGGDPHRTDTRQRIGYMPEGPYFYDYLTGDELLDYYGRLFGIPAPLRRARINELLNLVGMQERRQMPIRFYSRGMLQRIGLAQALINDPALLILDEPTSGLDPIGAYQLRQLIVELKQRGKTILLCSHLLNEVEDLCDEVGILYRGRLVGQGRLPDLLQDGDRHRTLEDLFIELVTSQEVPPEAPARPH